MPALQFHQGQAGAGEQQQVDLGQSAVHADEGQVRPGLGNGSIRKHGLDGPKGLVLRWGRGLAHLMPLGESLRNLRPQFGER